MTVWVTTVAGVGGALGPDGSRVGAAGVLVYQLVDGRSPECWSPSDGDITARTRSETAPA
jgi:hypothetical protein